MNENNSNFQDNVKKVLNVLYKGFQYNQRIIILSFEDYPENVINYLMSKGYIIRKSRFGQNDGMYYITADGINYIKNDYTEICSNPKPGVFHMRLKGSFY